MTYWYAPGMYYPYWWVGESVAHNDDTDTDMGDLTSDEFHKYFPWALEISEEEFKSRTIDPDQVLMTIRKMRERGNKE